MKIIPFSRQGKFPAEEIFKLERGPMCTGVGRNDILVTMDRYHGLRFPTILLDSALFSEGEGGKISNCDSNTNMATQLWYPLLLQKLIDFPVLIPMGQRTLIAPKGEVHPLITNITRHLAGWKVS